jgi:hypothetical protein
VVLAFYYSLSVATSSSGAELPLITERFALLNDLFQFLSFLDADDPVFNLHLTKNPV